MTLLKEHIDDIRNQLKQGAFTNEAEVSQYIIIRVLEVLGWPRYTPKVIIPEYGVEGQRVDFALCHPPEKPLVFIEVKQVGNLEGAEEQLFGYAFGEGVPIAILTDGQTWRFFHATGEGKYKDRKVYELDLIESESEESIERLNRYLNYEAIQIGDAVKAIKNDYQKVSKQREIEARLPEFWNELLQDKNEYLLLAVMEKAKDKVGHEPTEEQVLTFLKSLESKTVPKPVPFTPDAKHKMPSVLPNETSNSTPSPKSRTRLRVTMLNGEVIECKDASDTFLEVIAKLGCDEVMSVIPNVVSTDNFLPYNKTGVPCTCGRHFIWKDISTGTKKGYLEKIARDLDVQMRVETVEK